MHEYIYKNVRNPAASAKSYSQLECYECLKLTNKMLDDEIAVALKQQKKQQSPQQPVVRKLPSENTLTGQSCSDFKKKVVTHHRVAKPLLMHDGTTTRGHKHYAPATIAPAPLKPFQNLKKSTINESIRRINEAIFVLFKQKQKPDEHFLVSLFRYLQMPLPRVNGNQIDYTELKRQEFLNSVNQVL